MLISKWILPVLPPCRVDPNPLGNDWLIKVILYNVVTICIAPEEFWQAIYFFVINPIFPICTILKIKD